MLVQANTEPAGPKLNYGAAATSASQSTVSCMVAEALYVAEYIYGSLDWLHIGFARLLPGPVCSRRHPQATGEFGPLRRV